MSCNARFQPEGPRTQGGKGRAGQADGRARGEPRGKVSCVSWLCCVSEARQTHRLSHGSSAAVGHIVQARAIWNSGTLGAGSSKAYAVCGAEGAKLWGWPLTADSCPLAVGGGAVLLLVSLFRPMLFLSQLLFYPEVSAGARSDGPVPGLLPRRPPQPAP